jgi:hypothetical protein
MAAALARASRLRSAVGRLGCPRAFFASSASPEANASGRGARAFTSVAALTAGSGLGIWMLASKPQPLADSGLVADAAVAATGGGSGGFSATFGGAGIMEEREEKRKFLFGGELRWIRFIRVAVPIVAVLQSSFRNVIHPCVWISSGREADFALAFAPRANLFSNGSITFHFDRPSGHNKVIIVSQPSFADPYRRRVFFNYEKRIRTRSPPEKVTMACRSL